MFLRLVLLFGFAAPTIAAEKPAVVELLEDDAAGLLAHLTMGGLGGSEQIPASEEKKDFFTGKSALRVSPMQRFNPDIKGWAYVIAEKPRAGEFRYIRFAWKKLDDGPIMLQLSSRDASGWEHRYHAGGNPPWAAKELAPTAPNEWTVVTRDLFKDFGAFTLGGIAFTPHFGGDGLFDHVLLGRTLEDLDRATTDKLLAEKPQALTKLRVRQLWDALGDADELMADAARWSLLAGRKDAVAFLKTSIELPERKPAPDVSAEKVKPLIEALDHFRFVTREAAEAELLSLGNGVLVHLRKAADASEGETKLRMSAVLERWTTRLGANETRLRRCAQVLRPIDTPESKALLRKIEAWLQ